MPPYLVSRNLKGGRLATWQGPSAAEKKCFNEFIGLTDDNYANRRLANSLCAFTSATEISEKITCVKQNALKTKGEIISEEKVISCREPKAVAQAVAQETKNYRVEIDCYYKGLNNTYTSNRITVQFWAGDKRVKSIYRDGISESECGALSTDPSFGITTKENISHIVVKTDGEDAFFIDELRIFRNDIEVSWHGRDQGKGWCISKDETDNTRTWKGYADRCQEREPFPLY